MSLYKENVSIYLNAGQIALQGNPEGAFNTENSIRLYYKMRLLQHKHKCGIELFDPLGFNHPRFNLIPFNYEGDMSEAFHDDVCFRAIGKTTLGKVAKEMAPNPEAVDYYEKWHDYHDIELFVSGPDYDRRYSYINGKLPFSPCVLIANNPDSTPYMALLPVKGQRKKGGVYNGNVLPEANHYSHKIVLKSCPENLGYTNLNAAELYKRAMALSMTYHYAVDVFFPADMDKSSTDIACVVLCNAYNAPYLAMLPNQNTHKILA